jgi:hypothetical protein
MWGRPQKLSLSPLPTCGVCASRAFPGSFPSCPHRPRRFQAAPCATQSRLLPVAAGSPPGAPFRARLLPSSLLRLLRCCSFSGLPVILHCDELQPAEPMAVDDPASKKAKRRSSRPRTRPRLPPPPCCSPRFAAATALTTAEPMVVNDPASKRAKRRSSRPPPRPRLRLPPPPGFFRPAQPAGGDNLCFSAAFYCAILLEWSFIS